jgi:predicted NodU family carbamoyl transferase
MFCDQNLSANHDTVQQHIDTLLSDAEAKLQSLFDKLLAAIKQCRDTAKQTVNKSHSEQMDKLQTSLADKQKQSHNIKQHVASVEHHLTPSSSVFDKSKFIKDKLSDIENETRQAKTPLNTYLHTDISKWKTDMTAWLEKISDALTTATTRLPQLTEHSLVTHRFDIALSTFNTLKSVVLNRILLCC